MEGKSEVVATECDGEAFLFPNDLCFGPDGALYLTDSGVFIDDFAPNNHIRPDYLQMKYDGRVYRIDVSTGKVEKLDTEIKFTNGIAFGPDRRLYANESVTGNIYVYEWRKWRVSGRALFGNVRNPDGPPGWRGPDGMAFSTDGELYVAVFGQKDITVLESGRWPGAFQPQGSSPPMWRSPCPDKNAYTSPSTSMGRWRPSASRRTACRCGMEPAGCRGPDLRSKCMA